MIEMSPVYAHESKVGPVFDAATWSPGKAWFMAVGALVFGLAVVAAMIIAWWPTLLLEKPPEVISDIHRETLDLAADKPWIAYGVSALAGLIALASLAAAFASAADAMHGEYYFRAGPGGLSLCVPNGIDFSKFCLAYERLEVDIPLAQIADWRVVQHKQLGSMSRSAGNLSSYFKIRTIDGKKVDFSLDCFREPSFVIHSKLNDALQMVPAQLGPAASDTSNTFQPRTASRIEAKFDAILDALSTMVADAGSDSAVVISDPNSDKIVQFALVNDHLILDLPQQCMDTAERVRAADYIRRVTGGDLTSTTQTGFQVSVANADDATRLALEVFNHVYQLRPEEPLKVECVGV